MPVIAIINHKGGVGKTTTTVNLGAALQELGRRVLLVDLDPQASLTLHLGVAQPAALPASCGDALRAVATRQPSPTFREILLRSPAGLDLIPSGGALADVEPTLGGLDDGGTVLRAGLAPLRGDYDDILIDCLPSRTHLAYNAMAAADAILVPTQADYLAVQGLALTFQTAAIARERFHPRLRALGILLTMADARTKHSRWAVAAARRGFAGQVRVFETVIGLHVGFKESSRAGVSLLRHAPRSEGAAAYRALAREVVNAAAELVAEPEPPAAAAGSAGPAARGPMEPTMSPAGAPGAFVTGAPGGAAGRRGPTWSGLPGREAPAPAPPPPSPAPEVNSALIERIWGSGTCKFLGFRNDRSDRVDRPDPGHCCWADDTPAEVDLDWQRAVCQQRQSFWSCPRYTKAAFPVPEERPSFFGRLVSRLQPAR